MAAYDVPSGIVPWTVSWYRCTFWQIFSATSVGPKTVAQ